jgi:hypothetical protein
MLDPIEQAKGGFRAFAAREQERRDTNAVDPTAVAQQQADGAPAADPLPPDARALDVSK